MVLDLLRALAHLCAETEDAYILFNPGICGYLMVGIIAGATSMFLMGGDSTGRSRSCVLAYNILIQA